MMMYFNEHGNGFIKPFEFVKNVTDRKVMVRMMKVKKKDIGDLSYDYFSDEEGECVVISKRKNGRWHIVSECGVNSRSRRFYDNHRPIYYKA